MQISQDAHNAIRRHALSEYPREACGLIVDGRYIPESNHAVNPEISFEMLPEPGLLDRACAVVHSHTVDPATRYRQTKDPRTPSETDMQQQMALGIPYGITATDGHWIDELVWLGDRDIAPLLERPFISGIFDCWELARDWLRLNLGVEPPTIAREHDWLNKPNNYFLDMHEGAGFRLIHGIENFERGDVVLMTLGREARKRRYPDHCGIYLDGGELLHHLYGKPSCQTRFDRYKAVTICAGRWNNQR